MFIAFSLLSKTQVDTTECSFDLCVWHTNILFNIFLWPLESKNERTLGTSSLAWLRDEWSHSFIIDRGLLDILGENNLFILIIHRLCVYWLNRSVLCENCRCHKRLMSARYSVTLQLCVWAADGSLAQHFYSRTKQ